MVAVATAVEVTAAGQVAVAGTAVGRISGIVNNSPTLSE
jgi:hypothetical protein